MSEEIKSLKIIHIAMCVGLIAISYFMVDDFVHNLLNLPPLDSSTLPFLLVPVAAFYLSDFLFKNQMKQMDKDADLKNKLPIYQTANIIRWAILEVAAIVIVVLKPEFLILTLLIILYLFYLGPTESRVKNELNL